MRRKQFGPAFLARMAQLEPWVVPAGPMCARSYLKLSYIDHLANSLTRLRGTRQDVK